MYDYIPKRFRGVRGGNAADDFAGSTGNACFSQCTRNSSNATRLGRLGTSGPRIRVHRSHAVNLHVVRELRPRLHGEYSIILACGAEITSGRSYKAQVQGAFGLG